MTPQIVWRNSKGTKPAAMGTLEAGSRLASVSGSELVSVGDMSFWSTTCSLEVVSNQPSSRAVAPPAPAAGSQIGSR
jgi:hypothetical protein